MAEREVTDNGEHAAVIPGYIGWRNAEPDNANLRFYATDKADDPRWDKFHVGGRVAEYAVLDRDEWGEGDRILIVRAGNRFLSDDDFDRVAAACQAAVDGDR